MRRLLPRAGAARLRRCRSGAAPAVPARASVPVVLDLDSAPAALASTVRLRLTASALPALALAVLDLPVLRLAAGALPARLRAVTGARLRVTITTAIAIITTMTRLPSAERCSCSARSLPAPAISAPKGSLNDSRLPILILSEAFSLHCGL